MGSHEPLSVGVRCERARHWASLRLDGELSALEGEFLERHLASCPACREVERRTVAATSLLRAAPAERPSRRFVASARRSARRPVASRRTALIAAAALAIGALTGSLLQRPTSRVETPRAPQVSMVSRDLKQLQKLPREPQTERPAPVPSGPPNTPEGVI